MRRRAFTFLSFLFGLTIFFVGQVWQAVVVGIAVGFLGLRLAERSEKGVWPTIAYAATPALFALSAALVFVYFPDFGLFFKLFLVVLFSFLFYIILLAENVFKAVIGRGERFPLFRAAQTSSFLLALFIAFLFFTVVYKSPLFFLAQGLLVFGGAFLLLFAHLWFVYRDSPVATSRNLIEGSALISLGVVELSLALSFVPLKSFFRALAVATVFYIGLGFYKQVLDHSFRKKHLVEYLVVAVSVALTLIIL